MCVCVCVCVCVCMCVCVCSGNVFDVESEKLNQSRYRYETRCPKHSPMSIPTVMTSHTWDIASAISVKGFTATRIAHSFRSFIK